MTLPELLLAIGAITTILIQGIKTIPFIQRNSWLALPSSLLVGIAITTLYASSQANHFALNWNIAWLGLSVGLISGGFYAGTTAVSARYQAYKIRKAAAKAYAAGYTRTQTQTTANDIH